MFSTSTGGGKDPSSVLKILDLKRSQVSTIPGSKGMFSPRWSPDGQSIAAIREDSVTLITSSTSDSALVSAIQRGHWLSSVVGR